MIISLTYHLLSSTLTSKFRTPSEPHNDDFSLSTIAEGSHPNVRKPRLPPPPPAARARPPHRSPVRRPPPPLPSHAPAAARGAAQRSGEAPRAVSHGREGWNKDLVRDFLDKQSYRQYRRSFNG